MKGVRREASGVRREAIGVKMHLSRLLPEA
jgi:hypothetical protein